MQHFYDGQIKRYLVQTIRLLSKFVVKYGDGRLVQVPVMYGDMDRQVANLIKQNSENKQSYLIGFYFNEARLLKEFLSYSLNSVFESQRIESIKKLKNKKEGESATENLTPKDDSDLW
jgi:hypothetical protein